MSNIHFYNIRTKKHEFCNMKDWVLMHTESLAAFMITILKLMKAPIAFSMYGTDGDGYIVCDDASFADPFVMAHEEGHLRLGHYKPGADVHYDENGILIDESAEQAADRYAIEKTKNPKQALESLHRMMENMDEHVFKTKEDYVNARMGIMNRMLAISNLKI